QLPQKDLSPGGDAEVHAHPFVVDGLERRLDQGAVVTVVTMIELEASDVGCELVEVQPVLLPAEIKWAERQDQEAAAARSGADDGAQGVFRNHEVAEKRHPANLLSLVLREAGKGTAPSPPASDAPTEHQQHEDQGRQPSGRHPGLVQSVYAAGDGSQSLPR